jgi:uncharacterized protein
MHSVLADKLPQVIDLCRRHGVRRLEVFGSVLRDDFDPARSDIDFIVEFLPGPEGPWMARYFDFKDALEEVLEHDVDLLEGVHTENRYLRRAIESSRRALYDAA